MNPLLLGLVAFIHSALALPTGPVGGSVGGPVGGSVDGSRGVGAPAYLSVSGFKDCLGTKVYESHQGWCMPKEKPEKCQPSSWAELQKVFSGDDCDEERKKREAVPQVGGSVGGSVDGSRGVGAPAYLSVSGFKDCLGTKVYESHQGWCMPKEKPEKCQPSSWTELQKAFSGDDCDEESKAREAVPQAVGGSVGGSVGVGAPPYLSVPGFQDCLGKDEFESHQSWCMPKEKPDACEESSWTELQDVFVGADCRESN